MFEAGEVLYFQAPEILVESLDLDLIGVPPVVRRLSRHTLLFVRVGGHEDLLRLAGHAVGILEASQEVTFLLETGRLLEHALQKTTYSERHGLTFCES